MKWEKLSLFAGGVLFGTAGVKLLSSRDAKKVYTQTTAAALRAKECVMTTVAHVKENVDDILTDSKEINERRSQADSGVIEDEYDVDIEDEFDMDMDDIVDDVLQNGVENKTDKTDPQCGKDAGCGKDADCQTEKKNEK